MKVIRKVWIGQSIKSDDTMSWEVGQGISLGPEGRATVDHILKDEDGAHIYVRQDNKIIHWKSSNTLAAVEYDVSFE